MRVWDYINKRYDELGRVIWEVEWITVKPSAKGNAEIDPDADTITHVEDCETDAQAMKRAQEIYDQVNGPNGEGLCWGAVTVQKMVLEMYVEEDRVGAWEPVGESVEVTDFSESVAA